MENYGYDTFFEEFQDKLRREGGSYNPETGRYAADDDPWAIQDSDEEYWANICRTESEVLADVYFRA